MRNTTLPLLMGLISSLAASAAYAQESTNPSVNPTSPPSAAPSTGLPPNAAPPAPPPGAAGASGGSANEATPFVFGIRQGLTGDSNVFRAAEGSGLVRRDRIWSTGLHLGLDKTLGRQHFLLDLQANANRYNKNKFLNNTDYTGNARWDWETIERLSGTLSAQQRQSLFREIISGTPSLERNQVRTTSLGFDVNLGLVTLWSFEAGVAASDSDYMGAEVESRDVRQTSVNAGIRYRPSRAVSTGLGVRRTDGRYPNLPDDFTRDDIDLTTTFDASGASRLNSRVSFTKESHTSQRLRDSDGWTGALGWRWRPTGKITTQLDLSHDRSVGRLDLSSPLIGAETSDASEVDIASLAVTYEATTKIAFVPRLSYARRKIDNSFSTGGTPTAGGTDTTMLGALGMTYVPFTALTLNCQLSQERRKLNGSVAAGERFKSTIAGCNAEFALR